MNILFVYLLVLVFAAFVIFLFGRRSRFFVLVAALLSTVFLPFFSASAQQFPPFNLANGIYLKSPDGERVYHTSDHYSLILKNLNPNYKDDPSRNKAAFERDFNRSLNNGTWALVQRSGRGDNGKEYGFYELYFNYSRDCNIQLQLRGDIYYFFSGSDNPDCRFRRASFDANPISNYYGDSDLNSAFQVSLKRGDSLVALFLFNGDYSLAPGLEGLDIEIPKGVDDMPFIPLFWYKVEKLNFWGVYNGLGHVQGGSSDLEKPELDFNNWLWKVYNADDNFNIRGDPLFSYKTAGFNYDFTTYGNYIVTVEYDIHPPRVPPANVKPLKFTFKLKIDGSSYSSTSYDTCDSDGNCKVPEESCEFYSDAAARIQCRMRKAFNFGVFGPSLTAVNQMFSSFIVKRPKCLIPLSDTAVLGRTVSFSFFQSGVCARSDQLRQSFSVVPVLLNFLLAILILAMIVGIVNRVTNPHDNKIVEAP